MFSLKCVSRALIPGLLSIALLACSQETGHSVSTANDSLLNELSEIHGKYVWNDELKRYLYSEKQRIETILASRETKRLITTLVDCLDNPEPTNSILNENKVALGVICYEALSQTAYYEPTDAKGDISPKWSGNIVPTATPDELHQAKQAWEKVIESKSYILF